MATSCSQIEKGKQLVSQLTEIPWGHNLIIIAKCNSLKEVLFYVNETIRNGWSRAILTHQYALRNVNSPLGVSEYEITESLPDNLKSALPSVEEIEAEIGDIRE